VTTFDGLTVARFLSREKRFTVHAELADGTRVLAHTNNTGRLTGSVHPGCRCWLSPAADPRRKLPWTLEVSEAPAWPRGVSDSTRADLEVESVALDAPFPAPGRVLVGVNTMAPSRLVAAAIDGGLLPLLQDCKVERAEAQYPPGLADGSRADLLLRDEAGDSVWVEIKNVSLVREGVACFPDAPTTRGLKHLKDLATCVEAGHRTALVFCVQRGDADLVTAAGDIDPAYAEGLKHAARSGVQIMGLGIGVTTLRLKPTHPLPVEVSP